MKLFTKGLIGLVTAVLGFGALTGVQHNAMPSDGPLGGTDGWIKEDDSTAVKFGKGVAMFLGVAITAAGLGFIVGYTGKKGSALADRTNIGNIGGDNEDNTMTTAQAGARGGRQRAA